MGLLRYATIALRGIGVQGEGGRPLLLPNPAVSCRWTPPFPLVSNDSVRGDSAARPTRFLLSLTLLLLNVSNRAAVQWQGSRCYESNRPTCDVFLQSFEQRDRLALKTARSGCFASDCWLTAKREHRSTRKRTSVASPACGLAPDQPWLGKPTAQSTRFAAAAKGIIKQLPAESR